MNDKDIRTIGILKTMYQEERNLIGTDITNTNYTHRDKAQAIENLLKENENLKTKIKEKIEISKKQYEWFNDDKRPTKNIAKAYEIIIEFLQELLKECDNK